MEKYKIVGNISAGAHGIVLEAIRSPTFNSDLISSREKGEKHFAIKRIFIRKQNIPLSVIREIKSLQLLDDHLHVSIKPCSLQLRHVASVVDVHKIFLSPLYTWLRK